MQTQTVAANGLELAYEAFGDPADPPVVLVMGLGTQMVAWPDQLCTDLAAAGRYVVRYDNRDCGLSTHLAHLRAPDPRRVLLRRAAPPYTLEDMAEDLLGLLDALGLAAVHVVGASMGGFIAQTFALAHPERVLTLTLMMTSTGSRRVGRPRPRLVPLLLRRSSAGTVEEAIEAAVATYRLIGSPGELFDEVHVRDVARRSIARGVDTGGYLRQLCAVLAQPDRTARLRSVVAPTLVVHGLSDPLVGVSGGLALARAIPQARFVGHHGMGHDLPGALWPEYVADLVRHTDRHTGVAR